MTAERFPQENGASFFMFAPKDGRFEMVRALILGLVVFFLAASPALAGNAVSKAIAHQNPGGRQEARIYDDHGYYEGRVDKNGKFYDSHGYYQGRIKNDGKLYDKRGYYQGRVKEDGKFYDKRGYYEGRVDKSGRIYDRRGHYQGKIR
jgi:hypothetical protein